MPAGENKEESMTETEALLDDETIEPTGWICDCGHWQDNDMHCSVCGAQPPWGCDCSQCQMEGEESLDSGEDSLLEGL